MTVPLAEIPTKWFIFKCFRPVQERRPPADVVVAMMASRSTRNDHLPPVRERTTMHGKDILYNDLRRYLQDQKGGFPRDMCISVGDEFLKHLTSALFPLSLSVWKQLNDAHNRGGAGPDPELGAFLGGRLWGTKKTSRV